MPFTLEELLPNDQRLRKVFHHDTVQTAVNLMHQHGYSQLPVVDNDGNTSLGQVVTFDSILQALNSFDTKADFLFVKDVARNVRTYPKDADLLATLDDIQRENFALIVDENNFLTGIVTTADSTVFFREYAQDLMLIEGIETNMKEAIRALYGGDDSTLQSVVEVVTDRTDEVKKKLPSAIKAYLGKSNIPMPVAGSDHEALAEAEKKLGLPESKKGFEDLSFEEFTQVLLKHSNAPKLSKAEDVKELRGMLDQVRKARNTLAHFRGELTPEQRRTIRFASLWLERNLPVPSVVPPAPPAPVAKSPPGTTVPEEDDVSPKGSYAPLAKYLREQPADTTSVPLAFQHIEKILEKKLPSSAFDFRAWWANDPTKPQSTAWLEEGWRTVAINMSERQLTFIRSGERPKSFIEFFQKLNTRLKSVVGFPLRHGPPKGANWQALAFLPWAARAQSASLFATFTRNKELRIELYLDCGDRIQNKLRFEELMVHKREIEAIVGEPLSWEKRDENRASRIAVYTKAQIETDADNPKLVEWAGQKAGAFYKAFSPLFPE